MSEGSSERPNKERSPLSHAKFAAPLAAALAALSPAAHAGKSDMQPPMHSQEHETESREALEARAFAERFVKECGKYLSMKKKGDPAEDISRQGKALIESLKAHVNRPSERDPAHPPTFAEKLDRMDRLIALTYRNNPAHMFAFDALVAYQRILENLKKRESGKPEKKPAPKVPPRPRYSEEGRA
ncbi:hypothetical protein A3C21_01100 [Candidatus Kaiserbacteria bacterium RIFCSPHIGHO2_02_FULL_59_21]|uniref:Uncharacterized protein n=1 Tax=Candidatus Kaiserbacteria bacterium RIFCSPHIGHO2_02_FULL_59_21 TaxID=1798500 RepID=A0A1F6DZV8_9BACT|nr:MAG: hypothetical protein A2766_02095 [Candidatus Kaiserbacteria bacterium RIFCSPHIGHO2_01_FULL_58_22]OGG66953.1 MAG: hypothetical protein A3C21_01100 [Candidatus Kaiserbacteria bacterium RIFCSPHIGHO2_02_FULL_59_21]OGG80348.1 MAG: hypothetical protein A2952_02275 [Candidatus Kaiserbacteria bacterium RIFCSPLOWO2_01_FULL_59_34]OGG85661.1 MAG: hypothetical protein A3I47_00475 [Candidatus Kaiserbacteria bacterium RIFCSPLOWO2_02_FULL_59_19]